MINKDIIKANIEKILIYYGAKPGQYNWSCIPSRHKNPQNNLSIKNNLCCCHCGLQGDSFQVIAEMEGLNCKDSKDFLLIAKKAMEILNLPIEYDNRQIRKQNNSYQKKESKCKNNNLIDLTSIITNEYEKSRRGNYKYFYNRGFDNKVIDKYKIIVSNPKKIFPDEIVPRLKNVFTYEYIIPVWENGKIINTILRRNDWKSKENNKTLNLKGFNVEFFNKDYLKEKNKYLFICEGWSDSLSFESIGVKSIAINSITMINKLFAAIKKNYENLKNIVFFIVFDNDEESKKNWGQIASKDLLQKLRTLNIKTYNLKIKKPYKDVNEYFCNDKISFKKNINYLVKNIAGEK